MVHHPKNVIITGASSGIGEELAWQSARRGDYPILIARSESKLKQTQVKLQEEGFACMVYTADIIDEKNVKDVIAAIQKHCRQIDVLINNAGAGVFASVESITADEAKRMVEVNILGMFYMTKAVLPQMKHNRQGVIINIGSQAGKMATPKSSVYAATKHAVVGFSNALRLEAEASSIRVATVNTGPVRTPFIRKADPAGNYEKAVQKIFIDPADLAVKIMKLIDNPRRELNLPWWMAAVSRIHALFPVLVEKLAAKQFRKK